MALDEPVIGRLIVARALVFHPVFFGEALDLAMAKHRQARQSGHEHGDTETLVTGAELIDGRAFVGIAHEVDVALHDIRIEFERVLDDRAVLGVFLVAHHVHEGAVVDAMHAEGADKVALHEPEGFGKKQRAGDLGGHAVDHFAPEFLRHDAIELLVAHAVFGAGWNRAARSGTRKPEPVKVAFGQGHCGVEANYRKEPGDVKDRLDHLLAYRGIQVVELRSVVPRETCAIVAVIDVAGLPRGFVAPTEDYSSIGLRKVMVLDFDFDAAVAG